MIDRMEGEKIGEEDCNKDSWDSGLGLWLGDRSTDIVSRRSRVGVKDLKFTIAPWPGGACGMYDLQSTE